MSTKNPPKVVACLAAWNAESFIEKTLLSLAEQTYPNFHCLISVDLCTDNTYKVCQAFAASDSRFSVIQQQERLGWVGNVNALLKVAKGDYLFFMGHDDLVHPTYVESLVDALEKNPCAILAYSDMKVVNTKGDVTYLSYQALENIKNRTSRAVKIVKRQGTLGMTYRGVFRSEAINHIIGLRCHLAGEVAADMPWLLHMALLGEFVRIPQALYQKVVKKQGISRTWGDKLVLEQGSLSLSFAQELRKANLSPGEEIYLDILIAIYYPIFLLRKVIKNMRKLTKGWIKFQTNELTLNQYCDLLAENKGNTDW